MLLSAKIDTVFVNPCFTILIISIYWRVLIFFPLSKQRSKVNPWCQKPYDQKPLPEMSVTLEKDKL